MDHHAPSTSLFQIPTTATSHWSLLFVVLLLSSFFIAIGNSMTTTTTKKNATGGRAGFESIFGPPPGQFCKTAHGTTHYVLQGNEEGAKTKPLVVLQHGIGGDLRLLDRAAKDLLDLGYMVLRYDFYDRGYSETDPDKYPIRRLGVHPLQFTEEVYTQQLEDVLNHVFSNADEVPKFIHVSHSLGGLVGIVYAAKHPDKILGLALMDAVCLPVKKPLVAKLANLPGIGDILAEKMGAKTFEKFTRASVVDAVNHPIVGPFIEKQCQNVRENPRYFSSIRSSNQHCLGMVGSAETEFRAVCSQKIPIHLIWGQADTSVPYGNCCEMKRIAQELGCTVTEDSFEGMPHNVFFEDAKPTECSKSICDFVSTVYPTK